MTNKLNGSNVALLLAYLLTFGGGFAIALRYDNSTVQDCLVDPLKPKNNGGIMLNPEMNEGIKGWTKLHDVKLEGRTSISGNKFIVAYNRKQHHASMMYKTFLAKDNVFFFSAWIQIAGTKEATVFAYVSTSEGIGIFGEVEAKEGCWSMINGDIPILSSTAGHIYFFSDDIPIEIWVDSVSLIRHPMEEWKSHHNQTIEKSSFFRYQDPLPFFRHQDPLQLLEGPVHQITKKYGADLEFYTALFYCFICLSCEVLVSPVTGKDPFSFFRYEK